MKTRTGMLSFVPEVTLLSPSIALSAPLVTRARLALCILHTSTDTNRIWQFTHRKIRTRSWTINSICESGVGTILWHPV